MTRSTPSSRWRRRPLLVATALALGLVAAPVAGSAAHAGDAASVNSVMGAADAESTAALHVGVRQAAVGDPIPVTIVGGEPGGVWEVALAPRGPVLGEVTVGEDGTGTTLVALPTGTEPGSLDFVATSDGEEITTALSSAGDTGAPAPDAAPEPEATAADEDGIAQGVMIAGAVVGSAVIAAAAVLLVRRTTRTEQHGARLTGDAPEE